MESPDTMDDQGECTFMRKEEALSLTHRFAEEIGCSQSSGDAQLLACLQAAKASVFDGTTPGSGQTFPMIDGLMFESWPAEIFQKGKFADVPIIIGSTALENARDACAQWGQCGTVAATDVNRSAFEHAAHFGGAVPADVAEWYSDYASEYGWYAAYARASSDYGYICPAHRHATLMLGAPGRTSPVFRYWWSHLTQDWPQRSCYNVSHDAEIPYIFQNSHAVPFWLGYGSFNAAEQRLSKAIGMMWRKAAALGAPHNTSDGFAPAWPSLKAGSADSGLMDFSLSPSVIDFPVAKFCVHWDALVK